MPDINNLFDGVQTTQAPEVTGEEAMEQLVGEGKKYASVEEMAKAFVHGQHHIQTLEQETAALRETSQKAKSIEDVLAAIKGTDTQEPDQQPQDQQQPTGSELSVAEQIAAAFAERDQKSVAEQQDANRQEVITELGKLYGTEASQIYTKVGNDLGINLDELAGKSPAAVLKLVSDARPAQQHQPSMPNSTQRTQTPGQPSGVLNQSAIQKMYNDGKIKLHEKHALENKQLSALGPADFYK